MLATDHYEAALDFAAHNACANLGYESKTALLDWRTPEIGRLGTFGLVLSADVLYERPNTVALADLVPRLLAPNGEVLFADPRRDGAPAFLEMMEERGFELDTQNTTVERDGRAVRVSLHRLWRR